MTNEAAETHGLKIALISYLVLFALQLTAYFVTGILVLYAQALEVFSDVVVSTFLWLSLIWSRKPADEFHMFGHGRAQNVAALTAATILIAFMGIEVFREAVPRLSQAPETGQSRDTQLALVTIAISMAALAVPLVNILKLKTRGSSAKAQLVQLVKDELAYLPALGSVVLVARGFHLADPIASLLIGVIIVVSGLYLFRDNLHYLVGRAPGGAFAARVETAARSVKGVLGIHDFKAEYVGPNTVHTGFHIEVARGTPVEEADRIAHEVEERVSRETGCQHCVIHVDPAG